MPFPGNHLRDNRFMSTDKAERDAYFKDNPIETITDEELMGRLSCKVTIKKFADEPFEEIENGKCDGCQHLEAGFCTYKGCIR